MKKIMRKLVLSSFALGLAAVTLTTTTFAWYTSNTNVKASQIEGSTAESGSALLLISNDKLTADLTHPANWSTAIGNVREDNVHTVNGKEEAIPMVPLQYNPTEVKQTVDEEEKVVYEAHSFAVWGANAVGSVTTEGYIEFTLFFKLASTTQETLYISKMEIQNNTNDQLPVKDILSNAHKFVVGESAEALAKTTYSIDVLRTLLVQTEVTPYTQTTQEAGPQKGTTVYDLYNPETLNSSKLRTDSFVQGTSNAHKYYNEIMKSTISEKEELYGAKTLAAAGTNTNYVSLGTLPTAGTAATSGSYVKVTFRVFINGWDLACFDAVQGQKILMNLEFTTEQAKALCYTA